MLIQDARSKVALFKNSALVLYTIIGRSSFSRGRSLLNDDRAEQTYLTASARKIAIEQRVVDHHTLAASIRIIDEKIPKPDATKNTQAIHYLP